AHDRSAHPHSVPPRPLRLAAAAAALMLAAAPAVAQPEIVPAEHAVYDFLHAQRVAGRLPAYRHEVRPMDRATVLRHLDTLAARDDRLSGTARYWLGEYRREFFEPAEAIEQVFGPGGPRLPRRSDTEKFLYHHRDDDWRVAVPAVGSVQVRRR